MNNKNMQNDTAICCPKFKPELYDNKEYFWQGKTFIKDEVMQIMHIPLNVGNIITKMIKKVDEAGARPSDDEFLILFYEVSPWKSEIYMTTTTIVPNANNTTLSGDFLSKVFDGPYKNIPNFIQEMQAYAATKGKGIWKIYFHYAYCPKCAKKYGNNYMVAFAQTDEVVVK